MAQPFSRVYCTPEQLQRDSVRLRARLGRFCTSAFRDNIYNGIVQTIEMETGARVPSSVMSYDLDGFFQEAQLRDVLDAITHIYTFLLEAQAVSLASSWHAFVKRVMADEHTSYTLESDGSVTYSVDEAYGAARKATLAGLADPRWLASRSEFERAFQAMDQVPPDTNGAIRAIAAAVESAAKILTNNTASSIGPTEIERYIWPLVQSFYTGDQSAQDAGHELLKSYGKLVNASHSYRHGQNHTDEVRAPDSLTIALLTAGSAILRWLIELDDSIHKQR